MKNYVLGFFSLLFISAFVFGQEKSVRVLKYSDHEPLGNMRTRFIKDVFFRAVETESKGRLKIEDHWASEISTGYDALKAVATEGKADMAIVVPEYAAKNLPLHQLFKSFPTGPFGAEQVKFFRKVFAEVPEFGQELEKENVVNLFAATGYPVGFFSTKPLNSLDDIRGQKWRSASFWHQDFLRNTGAEPVTMPWNEGIYKALKEGTLDGLMVNIDGAFDLKVPETAPNVLAAKDLWMGHVYLLVINKKTWESLSRRDQKAFTRAAEKSYRLLGAIMDKNFDEQIKKIREMKAAVRILDKSETEKWKAATNYREVQNIWTKTQEDNGIKNATEVLRKVRKILERSK